MCRQILWRSKFIDNILLLGALLLLNKIYRFSLLFIESKSFSHFHVISWRHGMNRLLGLSCLVSSPTGYQLGSSMERAHALKIPPINTKPDTFDIRKTETPSWVHSCSDSHKQTASVSSAFFNIRKSQSSHLQTVRGLLIRNTTTEMSRHCLLNLICTTTISQLSNPLAFNLIERRRNHLIP